MQDQANPEQGALTVDTAAEAFRGLLSEAEKPATEEAKPESDEPEQPPPDEAEDYEPDPTAQVEGDDDGAEATAETDDTEPEPEKNPRYAVKVNGQEMRVTFDELKAGYQREADYRRKTMDLAEERRAIAAEKAQAKQLLDTLIPQLQEAAKDRWADVDWVRLASDDPAGYVAKKAEFEAHQQRLWLASQERQRIQEQEQAEQSKAFKARLADEHAKLVDAIPAFRDQKKAKEIAANIKAYLVTEGFTPDEIAGVSDHRALKLAHKAWLYDQSQKQRVVAAEKAKTVPKVVRPGTGARENPATAERQKAFERLRKTGSIDDAAAVFRTVI